MRAAPGGSDQQIEANKVTDYLFYGNEGDLEEKILRLVEDGLISKLDGSENYKAIEKEDSRFIYSGFLVTGIVENVEQNVGSPVIEHGGQRYKTRGQYGLG